jgi:hypothetical protein
MPAGWIVWPRGAECRPACDLSLWYVLFSTWGSLLNLLGHAKLGMVSGEDIW